jgi:hypothetical protein
MPRGLILPLMLTAGAAPPAFADNIAYAFNGNSQSWFTTLWQTLELNENGGTKLVFDNPKDGLVSVTISAECQLIARTTAYITLNVIIDGSVVRITNGDDALCAGRGSGVEGGWAYHGLTVAKSLKAGSHTLRIEASTVGLHNGARIDDLTVLVAR